MEQKEFDSTSTEWHIVGSPVTREVDDLHLCDLDPLKFYLLKVEALSDAGKTTVLYKVRTGNGEFVECWQCTDGGNYLMIFSCINYEEKIFSDLVRSSFYCVCSCKC